MMMYAAPGTASQAGNGVHLASRQIIALAMAAAKDGLKTTATAGQLKAMHGTTPRTMAQRIMPVSSGPPKIAVGHRKMLADPSIVQTPRGPAASAVTAVNPAPIGQTQSGGQSARQTTGQNAAKQIIKQPAKLATATVITVRIRTGISGPVFQRVAKPKGVLQKARRQKTPSPGKTSLAKISRAPISRAKISLGRPNGLMIAKLP